MGWDEWGRGGGEHGHVDGRVGGDGCQDSCGFGSDDGVEEVGEYGDDKDWRGERVSCC